MSGIAGDNLIVAGYGGEDVVAEYDKIKADADSAHISWGEDSEGIDLVIDIDVYDDDGSNIMDLQFQI